MAKKPVKITDDMTDEEIAAAKAEATVEVVADTAPTVTANKPAPFFITSMNQGTLAEANQLARDQRAAEQVAISAAYRAAIEAVNKAFSTLTPVMSVEEAAALRK